MLKTNFYCFFKIISIFSIGLILFSCNRKIIDNKSIIEKYISKGAFKYHYLEKEYNLYIDSAIKENPKLPILYHYKAIPLWKTHKYELALDIYNKAVKYDREKYLSRRGYYKCIFKKDYLGAIKDLKDAEKEYGYGYENDHSYKFYISLSYLQLNRFEEAYKVLNEDIQKTKKEYGDNNVHFTELFYMGIILYELDYFEKAIIFFDKSINIYNNFSDAKYYKGLCLIKLNRNKEADLIMKEGFNDFKNGFSITENDVMYEIYPYQVRWYMEKWLIPGAK